MTTIFFEHPYVTEDRDAWFSRADRFDGFDRGDIGFEGRLDEPEEALPPLSADDRARLEFFDLFVGPIPPDGHAYWDIPF